MKADLQSRTSTTLLVLLRDPADPQAWQAFVERYTPKVLAWCRQWRLQPADACDVTQEVLYKLVQQLHRFHYDPARGSFRGWLKTLTRHAWADLRDRRRRAGWGSGDPGIQQLLDDQEDRHSLAEALEQEFQLELYEEARARVQRRVSPETWQAFQLLVDQGLAGADVAGRLGQKITTVYVAKHRVQAMLTEEIRRLDRAGLATPEDPS